MKEAAKGIARAMRCAVMAGDYEGDCTVCRYWKHETLTPEEQEMLGMDEWYSCDVEQICLDAVDMIERFAEDAEEAE